MTATLPVRIVGGGLAGLSLGIALRKSGLEVEIFEAGDYPRHRVCGEFITGLCDTTIEELGLGPALSDAKQLRRVSWFLDNRPVGRYELPAPARALSRYVLDARLAKIFVEAGGRLTTNNRYTAPGSPTGMVHASGRRLVTSSSWFGLKLHVRDLEITDDLELHLGEGAYVGLSTVEDGWTNMCGLFKRRPGVHLGSDDGFLANLRAGGLSTLAERFAVAQIRPGSRCAVAGFVFDRRVSKSERVQLGDRCAMIPPFTGNGMAMAFRSASLARGPLTSWARREKSWSAIVSEIHEALQHEFRVRLATAEILHPFLLDRRFQLLTGRALRSGLFPTTTLYRLLH